MSRRTIAMPGLWALLALLLVSGTPSAVLSVQDFSCNGGLSNVQLGVPFNCVAVILNDDLQADAALTSVTLSSLNGWTATASYSGSFSGNSVPRGSTLSVTFSGIVASVPGSGRKFSDVLINGGSGNAAKLADAALNVLSIKSTSASASVSTAAISTSFDLQSSFNVGGQANLTVDVGLTGCTLEAGQAASHNFGIVSDSVQSTSWKVTQSSPSGSTCTLRVEFRAVADPVTLTDVKTLFVLGSGTAPVPASGSGSSTGSPGGSAGAAGGGSSAGSAGRVGGGGGASSRSNELFPIFGLPARFDQVAPGIPSSTRVTISSFYTGFLRYVNLTLSGIPQEWYSIEAPTLVGPISNTTFDILWHVPEDARGSYPVVLTIRGVGTKTAGILTTNHSFTLVLPPAENAYGQSGTPAEPALVPAEPQPWIPPLSPADATNFSIVGFALFIGILLLAIHYHFTHKPSGDEQSNPLPKEEKSNDVESGGEGKSAKSKKRK